MLVRCGCRPWPWTTSATDKHAVPVMMDGQKGPEAETTCWLIQDCSTCHMPAADIVITLNRMDPVAFSHIRHLAADPIKKTLKSAGFSCSDCHPEPFERISKGPVGMEVPHENGRVRALPQRKEAGRRNAAGFRGKYELFDLPQTRSSTHRACARA